MAQLDPSLSVLILLLLVIIISLVDTPNSILHIKTNPRGALRLRYHTQNFEILFLLDEVVPSSSLVEVEVEVWVEVWVEVEVWGEVEVGVEQKYVPPVGWGGWLEIWRVRLSQLPTWLKLKLKHELGKNQNQGEQNQTKI